MAKTNHKNAIYICTSSHLWRGIASYLKNHHHWEPKFYVGFEENKPSNDDDIFKNAFFYNMNAARSGAIPQDVPNFQLGSFSEEDFANSQYDFDLFMEMCERFTIYKKGGTYSQRKGFYIHLCRLWTGIIDLIKPDVVVIASRPHRIFDVVVEGLCRQKNIPIVMLEDTFVNNCIYAVNIPDGLAFPEQVNNQKLEISDAVEKYVLKQNASYEIAKPVSNTSNGFFTKERQKKENSLLYKAIRNIPPEIKLSYSLFKRAIKFNLFEKVPTTLTFSKSNIYDNIPKSCTKLDYIFQQYLREKQIIKCEKFYRQNKIKPDLTKKYVYFSASYQPERSTCPDAGRYHDLYLTLRMISAAIPNDTLIYFKEHPRTFAKPVDSDAQRSLYFYKKIKDELPNVRFIDNTSNPFDLIDNASAIALTTGTTAIEAAVRQKKTILFGDNWFRNAPNIHYVQDNTELKRALNDQIETKSLDEIKHYLAELEQFSDDISYMFSSNVSFRKDVQSSVARQVTTEEQNLIDINCERAAGQIIRAANLSN